MYQIICRFLFFKILGWSCKVSIPDFHKCILCVAPHTSNWDFLIAQLFYGAIGRRSGFLMKKSWIEYAHLLYHLKVGFSQRLLM